MSRSASQLVAVPTTIRRAKVFVGVHHRHAAIPHGALFALGAAPFGGGDLLGVATVGRPVAKALQDGFTAEVTRLATDGTACGCSFLYGLASRVCRDLGYTRLLTYILVTEPGASLVAAGWRTDGHVVPARGWARPKRARAKRPVAARLRWWAPWSRGVTFLSYVAQREFLAELAARPARSAAA